MAASHARPPPLPLPTKLIIGDENDLAVAQTTFEEPADEQSWRRVRHHAVRSAIQIIAQLSEDANDARKCFSVVMLLPTSTVLFALELRQGISGGIAFMAVDWAWLVERYNLRLVGRAQIYDSRRESALQHRCPANGFDGPRPPLMLGVVRPFIRQRRLRMPAKVLDGAEDLGRSV